MRISSWTSIIFAILTGVEAHPTLFERGSCAGSDCDSLHFKRNEVPHHEYDWHKRDGELEKRIVLQCKYKKTCCCPNGGQQCMKCVLPAGCTFTCN